MAWPPAAPVVPGTAKTVSAASPLATTALESRITLLLSTRAFTNATRRRRLRSGGEHVGAPRRLPQHHGRGCPQRRALPGPLDSRADITVAPPRAPPHAAAHSSRSAGL